MPREIADRDLLVCAVRNLSLTAELFEELKGKPKYAGDREVVLQASCELKSVEGEEDAS